VRTVRPAWSRGNKGKGKGGGKKIACRCNSRVNPDLIPSARQRVSQGKKGGRGGKKGRSKVSPSLCSFPKFRNRRVHSRTKPRKKGKRKGRGKRGKDHQVCPSHDSTTRSIRSGENDNILESISRSDGQLSLRGRGDREEGGKGGWGGVARAFVERDGERKKKRECISHRSNGIDVSDVKNVRGKEKKKKNSNILYSSPGGRPTRKGEERKERSLFT